MDHRGRPLPFRPLIEGSVRRDHVHAFREDLLRPRYALVLIALLLAGCHTTLALDPYVPDSLAGTDPRLFGPWVTDPDPDDSLDTSADSMVITTTLTRISGRGPIYDFYDAVGRKSIARGRWGRIGRHWVLDLTPDVNDDEDALAISGHFLAVVEFVGTDSLRLYQLSENGVRRDLEDGTLPLPYVRLEEGGEYVITAPMEQLRREIAKYIDRPGALDTLGFLHRKTPTH